MDSQSVNKHEYTISNNDYWYSQVSTAKLDKKTGVKFITIQ